MTFLFGGQVFLYRQNHKKDADKTRLIKNQTKQIYVKILSFSTIIKIAGAIVLSVWSVSIIHTIVTLFNQM